MTYQIQLRRDSAANWTAVNPILAAGEPGLETDTGRIKYGDGVTRWNSLNYPTLYSTPTPSSALTGTTLPPNILNSSLTSVGTLTNLTVTNTIIGNISGNAATATTAVAANSATSATSATSAGTATTLSGGGNLQLVYQTGTGQIAYINAPAAATANQFLSSNGSVFAWSQVPAAAAGTLTGATLASNVLTSSLTSVGTLATLTVTATITGSVSGSAGSVSAGNITGNTLASNVTSSSLTTIGTLANLIATNATVNNSLGANAGITTTATTFPLVNTTATTVNFAGAATSLNMGASTGTTTINNNLTMATGKYITINGSNLTFGDAQQTNRYYVDPARTDSYTADGTRSKPYLTIGAALTAINTRITGGYNTSNNPIYIMLQGSTTENITLTLGRVYIVGEGGGIHAPIYITGTGSTPTITVNPTTGDLSSNRFSLMGVQVVGASGQNVIYVTGTSPLRMFMQDVWITANASGGNGAGYYQDNTGIGTIANGDSLKLSQNGTGDVYCINIVKNSASFNQIETSGATQVAAVQTGASLTINGSELDAGGAINSEVYGTGTLTITNSVITNSVANSSGVQANGGGTLIIGNCVFSIPTGSGKAIKNNSGVSYPSAGYPTLAYAGVLFTTGYNTSVDTTFLPIPQTNLVGTIASSTLVSPTLNTSLVAGGASIDVLNTTATTINAFGASTTLTLGAASGTLNLRNATITAANATTLNINGASPSIVTSDTGTASVFNTSALTGNLFGAATNITIGNTTTAAQNVSLFSSSTGASTYNFATGSVTAATTKAINIGTGGAATSTTNITMGASAGTGATVLYGTTGNLVDNATTITLGNTATAAQTINIGTASTGASTYNFATGATTTGITKSISIGTGGASGSTTNISIGSSAGTSNVTIYGPQMTGTSLNAGTASLAPLKFISGTNLTSAQAGTMEYDGSVFYATPATSTRSIVAAEQYTVLTSVYNLTSTTSAQKLFNTSTNGTVTLAVGNYQFECFFSLSAMNAGSGQFGFGLAAGGTGPATFTQSWYAEAQKSASNNTAATPFVTYNTSANTGLTSANTATLGFAFIRGYINVTVAGTVVPQVSLTVANAAVVGVGSYFKVSPLSTTNLVGNWS